MKQVILKAPGLRDPGGVGQKWTNDGYQIADEKSGNLRNVTEKWEKGKNVIRDDVHKSDPDVKSKAKEHINSLKEAKRKEKERDFKQLKRAKNGSSVWSDSN